MTLKSLGRSKAIPHRILTTAAVDYLAALVHQQFGGGMGGRGTSIRPGDLLLARGSGLGVGKAARPGPNGGIVLSYFDVPGADLYEEEYPHAALTRFTVTEGERVFWRVDDGDTWASGRVVHTFEDGTVFAKSSEVIHQLAEKQVHIRWLRPLRDVVGLAAAGLTSSPYLAESRRPFLIGIDRQRAAARGFGSLSSAVIELHEHQLEVARRVLEDPVQRYLLADEVGLGKTIEAGLVLRQLALDLDSLKVGIIAPPFLLAQWERELNNKFLLNRFPHVEVRLWPNDEPETWEACDVLVVDEAHRLANRSGRAAAIYERLAEVCHGSTRLLLLSATPALSNPAAFLGMLHLLDPSVHHLSDVPAFETRVAARQELGRILLGLDPSFGASPALLQPYLDDLVSLFPDDVELSDRALVASSALKSGDDAAAARAVTAVRVHLSETHRLHRRMLRTRRTDALRATFNVRGRSTPEHVHVDLGTVEDELSAWRNAALDAAGEDPDALASAAAVLAALVESAGDSGALARTARASAEDGVPGADALNALAVRADAFRLSEVAATIADALLDIAPADERTVVFGPTTELADLVAAEASVMLGEDRVETHTASHDPAAVDGSLAAFANPRDPANTLVCDHTAEEGRNLQFADVLVHVGLPSDPNRLEQRIGRLDRWSSSTGAWRSTVIFASLLPSWAQAWSEILANGFGVFGGSIATLQHAVGPTALAAWSALLQGGPGEASDAAAEVRRALDAELERVTEQDAIDAIEAVSDDRGVHAGLVLVEGNEDSFADAGAWLLGGSGNLRLGTSGDPRDGIGEYLKMSGRGHAAKHPLLPTWRLMRLVQSGLLDGRPVTFRRSAGLRHVGTSLLRFGDPLLAAVTDLLRNDHLGRTWMLWRAVPGWTGAEQVWFRLDLLVEADVDAPKDAGPTSEAGELDPEVSRVAARLADGLLPPLVTTRWLGLDGREPDLATRELLERPYARTVHADGHIDRNLRGARLRWLDAILPGTARSAAWREVEARALAGARDLVEVRELVERATDDAGALLPVRRQQLERRAAMAPTAERAALEVEAEAQRAIERLVLAAVSEPQIRIDGAGMVVLSGALPPEQTD